MKRRKAKKTPGPYLIHAPIIMAYPDAWIYLFDEEGIRQIPYVETDHYSVTRGFLSNPQRSLSILLADEKPA